MKPSRKRLIYSSSDYNMISSWSACVYMQRNTEGRIDMWATKSSPDFLEEDTIDSEMEVGSFSDISTPTQLQEALNVCGEGADVELDLFDEDILAVLKKLHPKLHRDVVDYLAA